MGYSAAVNTASVRLPSSLAAVSGSRTILTAVLRAWRTPTDQVDDVALLVTELASNAVHNAGGEFTVTIDAQDGTMRIAVQDNNPDLPRPSQAGPDAEHGRRLQLVQALSTRWGADPTPGGKQVWFELAS